jgi:hypothetical protein
MEGSETFKYTKLNPKRLEIRLLKVFPAASLDARVECTLDCVSLDNANFNALSYTWGDPKDLLPIYVNNHEFLVRRNLESALRHLRKTVTRQSRSTICNMLKFHSKKPQGNSAAILTNLNSGQPTKRVPLPKVDDFTTLWVDAICINQTDIPERDSEFRQMGAIYRRAKQVQVWLGEDNDIDSSFFDNLLEAGLFAQTYGNTSIQESISRLFQSMGFEDQFPTAKFLT